VHVNALIHASIQQVYDVGCCQWTTTHLLNKMRVRPLSNLPSNKFIQL